jgi:hypothetical protein
MYLSRKFGGGAGPFSVEKTLAKGDRKRYDYRQMCAPRGAGRNLW